MGADDVGSVDHGNGGTGQRADETVPGFGLVQNFADKGLARGSDEQGKAERAQVCQRPQHQAIPLVPGHPGLAKKADSGVEHDLPAWNAGLLRARQTVAQGVANTLQGRSTLGMLLAGHQDCTGSRMGNQPGQSRIMPQTAHIVDNPSAGLQGGPGRPGSLGIG